MERHATEVLLPEDRYVRTFAGRPRIEALTGIRWFAALAVFFSHYGIPAPAPSGLTTLALNGYAGVTFFFVLSGFVLTVNYLPAMSRFSRRATTSFFGARFARLAPAYFATLLFALYVPVLLEKTGGGDPSWIAPLGSGDLWLHVLALQAWNADVTITYGFNAPAWSVSVEVFLYAMFPIIGVLTARVLQTPRGALLLLVTIVAVMEAILLYFYATGRAPLPKEAHDSAHRWLYRTPLLRLGDFMLGISAARLWQLTRDRPPISRRSATIAQFATLFLVVLFASRAGFFNIAPSYDLLYALPATALFLLMAWQPASALALALAVRPIVYLGEISYGFYLLHYPMRELVSDQFSAWGPQVTVGLAATILAAALLHVAVEDPGRRLLRRLLIAGERPKPT